MPEMPVLSFAAMPLRCRFIFPSSLPHSWIVLPCNRSGSDGVLNGQVHSILEPGTFERRLPYFRFQNGFDFSVFSVSNFSATTYRGFTLSVLSED